MASPISDRRRSCGGWVAQGLLLVVMVLAGGARAAVAAQAPATADDSQARAAASARMVEGVELLRTGQYADALRKFDEVYALVPSPNVHFNRGLAYRGLGQNAAAVEAFEAFLAGATNPPPGKREQAQRYRDELRPRVARVVLTSELPGAELLVDDRPHGFTTAGRVVYLEPGSHELVALRRDRGLSARAQVTATAGQELAVTLRTGAAPVAAATPPAPTPAGASASARDRDRPDEAPPLNAAPSERNDDANAPGSAWAAVPRWALIAAGGGVVLLGAGVTFELLARREGDRVSAAVKVGKTRPDGADWDPSNEDNGLRYQTLGFISLGVGAAAVVAGITGYALAHRSFENGERASRPARGVRSMVGGPLLGPGLAGARLELSF
ncbi:MAG TPA: hypothetical protein VFH68_16875 [Polyangia bacterium]|nr:hypothetical protein [Polyangia bacterium]